MAITARLTQRMTASPKSSWFARLALAGAAICAPSQMAIAQDNAPVTAQSEVMQQIILTKTRDMDFGRIIVPRSGRVDMTAEENPTCTPNNTLIVLDTCQTASFAGLASNSFQIRVTLPAGRRIELTGPGTELRLRRMTAGAGDGLTFIGRTGRNYDFLVTDTSGNFEFHIGARLLFRNNQTSGVYTGTFTLETDYQ